MANLYDQEDVDVKAKNVHIDLTPHEHEDTYEALAKSTGFNGPQPEPLANDEIDDECAMAAPHSNVSEVTSPTWHLLRRLAEALPQEFQDYPQGEMHPLLKKAREDLKTGLDWVVGGIRKAVPDLDKFANQPKPNAPKAGSGAGAASSEPETDILPGPGGKMYHAGMNAPNADKPVKPEKERPGTGGYWELAKLTKELEAIPSMPSDKAMHRLQTVTGDLHKLKRSLSKNPGNNPEIEKVSQGVQAALQGIPAVMKSAGTLLRSAGSEKGLWQRKMDFYPEVGPDPRGGPNQDPKKHDVQRWIPKKMITYPTGQDVKRAPTKKEKEAQAAAEKQAAAKQRAQPTVRKGGGEKEKGPVKPTIPAAAYARAQPKIRRKGESAWDDLAALFG